MRVSQVATPGKCGGKGSAFKKPGPDERFKAGAQLRAREYAMSNDRGHDARYQLVVDAIDKHGPTDGWKQRAKLNVTPFYLAALNGKGPSFVNVRCGKCKGKEHSHDVFCLANSKPRQVDINALNKVKVVLRQLATQARADMSEVRQASQ